MICVKSTVLVGVLSAVLIGCSGQSSRTASANAQQASAPPPAPAHESASATPAGQNGAQTVSGTVVETMNASNYTYVRVKTGSGDVWAATSQFSVAVGDRVTVPLESPMEKFHSQSLKRDFPLIYFASQITREGESPASADPHGTAAGTQRTTVAEPIAPPEGGTAIAKIWTDRDALAGKKVTVRGKVVKYNGGIMGRNWIHIQDGSGKAADGSNDLTLTTNDEAKVGDVVTATGTVAVNKDFGSGYRYAVMLEQANVTTK